MPASAMRLPKRIDGTFDDEEEGQSLGAHAMQEDLSAALQEIRSLRMKMQQLEEEHEFLLRGDRPTLVNNTRNEVAAGVSSLSPHEMASMEESLEGHESHPASLEDQLLLENETLATSTIAPQSLLRGVVEGGSHVSFESEIPGRSHVIDGVKKSGNHLNAVKYNRRVQFSKDYYHPNDHIDNQKDLHDFNENERNMQLRQNLATEEKNNRRKILALESQTSSYRLEIERMKKTLSRLENNDSLMHSSVNRCSDRSIGTTPRSLFSGLGTGILAGPTVASSIVIHDDGFPNEESYAIKLDSDTFALMFIAKPCSQNWAIGISAFTFQITLGVMILWNQIGEGRDSSIFNVPFKVDLVVRTGQFLTIILCISTQSDILTSIQAFLLFERGGNWNVSIAEDGNTSTQLWITRVLIPNAAKLIQGLIVILTSYVIIVQSDNIITLLKDFTALMVLSETDNILFGMAEYGYLGERLQVEARKVNMFEFEVKHESTISPAGDPITTEATASMPFKGMLSRPIPRKTFRNHFCLRTTIIFFLFIAKISGWLVIVIRQTDGTVFKYKYPDCVNQTTHESYFQLAKEHFFDDECYGGPLNSLGCKFEGGDCVNFNLAYPLCKGDDLKDVQQRVGDGFCHKEFATYECDFDGGDCCSRKITRDRKFGDGQCQAGIFATENCGFDNGDCNTFVRKYPDCELESLSKKINAFDVILGNAVCESGMYNSKKCGFEAGDCDEGQIGQDLLFSDGFVVGGFLSFGAMMSRDGSHVAIATPHAQPSGIVEIFRNNPSMMRWESVGKVIGPEISGRFGGSIAMNFDGSRIAIGNAKSGEKGSSTGSVQVYEMNAISAQRWTQIGQTIQGIGAFSDTGHRVDLTRDGNRIAISSPSYSNRNVDNSGHIRVFDLHADGDVSSQDNIDKSNLQWIQVGDTIKGQKSSETIGSDNLQFIGSDGSTIMFSANGVTRFCTFSKESKNSTVEEKMRWSHFPNDIKSPNSIASVSSANGKMIAISSNSLSKSESGLVTIYELVDSNSWKQVGDVLVAVKSSIADGFGYDLAMSDDGHLLAISSIQRGCNKMIGYSRTRDEFCATGSVVLYSYDNITSRFRQAPPTKFEQRKRDRDESMFGIHISMAGDKSKLSISGFNFRDTMETKATTGGFVKVYNLNEIFYPKCNVTSVEEIGNNSCHEFLPYISKECGFDGGDCNEPTIVDGYPDCLVSKPDYVGSGTCYDMPPYFTAECGWDGGDCKPPEQIDNYPDCVVGYSNLLGNAQCDDRPPYNTRECGYDKGDCPIPNDED